jgi:hypothetical protein
MKKQIQVTEFSPPSGSESIASAFPGPGIYVGTAYSSRCLFTVGNGIVCQCLLNGNEPKEAAPEAKGGVSEATLLRAIAIVQGKVALTEITL